MRETEGEDKCIRIVCIRHKVPNFDDEITRRRYPADDIVFNNDWPNTISVVKEIKRNIATLVTIKYIEIYDLQR